VIGLIIAAIFAAAMSSVSAELAALSTATVIDFYRRHFRTEAPGCTLPLRLEDRRPVRGGSSPAWSLSRRVGWDR
jgi:hypothetical protein